jgi:hypothetical protein
MDFGKDFILDDNIAGSLDVPLNDLSGLREVANDPTDSIVDSVKNFYKDYPDSLIAVEIEQFLIRPFA